MTYRNPYREIAQLEAARSANAELWRSGFMHLYVALALECVRDCDRRSDLGLVCDAQYSWRSVRP